MRPISELVASARDAGASIRRLDDGRFSLVGSVPDAVLQEIRERREEFIDAWEADRRNRYLQCPPPTLLLRSAPPHGRADVRKRVESYALGQGVDVGRWVLLRGAAYQEANPKWKPADAATSALADLLTWQFSDRHPKPEEVLMVFDEVLRC